MFRNNIMRDAASRVLSREHYAAVARVVLDEIRGYEVPCPGYGRSTYILWRKDDIGAVVKYGYATMLVTFDCVVSDQTVFGSRQHDRFALC